MAEYTIKTDTEEEHRSYIDGPACRSILWDVLNHIRGQTKHGDHSDEVDDVYVEIRTLIHDLLNSEGVSLD